MHVPVQRAGKFFFRGTGLPTAVRKNQPLVPRSNLGGKVCARTDPWFRGQTLLVPGHGGGRVPMGIGGDIFSVAFLLLPLQLDVSLMVSSWCDGHLLQQTVTGWQLWLLPPSECRQSVASQYDFNGTTVPLRPDSSDP